MRWRSTFILIHRYIGLSIAGFVFVAGATGALLAYKAEIERWLNPPLYDAEASQSALLDGFDVRERMLARYPDAAISRVDLRPPLAGMPYAVYFDRAAPASSGSSEMQGLSRVDVNPVTGEVVAEYDDSEGIRFNRRQLMSTLVSLHYRLWIPGESGRIVMGVAAMLWFFDHFVALALSFPRPRQWRKSFAVRWRAGSTKITYDLHRATGVWLWGLLLAVACTSFSYNLSELFNPLVNAIAPLSKPVSFAQPRPASISPRQSISFEQAYRLFRADIENESSRRHFGVRYLQFMALEQETGLYRLQLNTTQDIRRDFGRTQIYMDAASGKILGWQSPQGTTQGDWFIALQAPLHVGDLVDIPQWLHQLLLCLAGLATAALSVTGVMLWAKKSGLTR